jgi:hypothetical protein
MRARRYHVECLLSRVADMCGLDPKEVVTGGRKRRTVLARSLLCYRGTRELGLSAVGISKQLSIAPYPLKKLMPPRRGV